MVAEDLKIKGLSYAETATTIDTNKNASEKPDYQSVIIAAQDFSIAAPPAEAEKCTGVIDLSPSDNEEEGKLFGGVGDKIGVPEKMLHCTKCNSSCHPTCISLCLELLQYVTKYNWECSECKGCSKCNDHSDEEKMLFCDLCDRG